MCFALNNELNKLIDMNYSEWPNMCRNVMHSNQRKYVLEALIWQLSTNILLLKRISADYISLDVG